MFDVFRKHTKIMMVLLFVLVIPSFVLLGLDGYNRMQESTEVVAKVGKLEITKAQWDDAHKNEVDRLRSAQPQLDVKLLDSDGARLATLERMVRDRVLALAAQDARLLTSDARLARFLQEDPTIASLRQPNGKLDMDRYRQLAANQGLTPEGFENSVRDDISRQQVQAGIVTSSFAAAAVADVSLNAFFERREIQFANFLTKDYASGANPTEAELQTFYQVNESLFKASEQAKVEYVVLDIDAVKKSITVAEADARSYYEQNAARLSGKEGRRASHILISAPKDASVEARQKAKDMAESLLKTVRAKPESFADIAKKNSQDPGSAAKGGDLDYFERGAMVKSFEDAVFSMKKGDISEVVTSDFGYHIIRLTDVKLPVQRSFDELRTGIEADLKAQQAQRKYAEVAELFTNTVYEQSDSLKPVADKLGLPIQSIDALVRQPLPGAKGVLASEKFLAAIFSADSVAKKRNTEAIEVGVNQLVAGRIVSYSPQRTLPFNEVRPQVQQRVAAAAALELARHDGNAKLTQWKQDASKAVLSPALVVSREQASNVAPQMVLAALRADTAALPAWLGVELGSDGFAVVRVNKLMAREDVPMATRQREREQYTQRWTSAEAQAYYAALKDRFKVQMLVPAIGASVSK
ncbi:MAG: SurA N-terminal domain-containing protein [Rhodoferax sp.]|nr:SurA N-terminal domain-containing protein [Rhodoferax sp.]